MRNTDLKDHIVHLLEEIAERVSYINQRHPEKQDLSLDIDLVKDDLRRLYRQFELLKNANGAKPFPPEEGLKQSADVHLVSDVSNTGGKPAENEEEPPAPKQEKPVTSGEGPFTKREEPLTRQEEPVTKREQPVTRPEIPVPKQAEAASTSVERPEETPAAKQSEPHPGKLPEKKPADMPEELPVDKPVEEPREKGVEKREDQAGASPKSRSGSSGTGNSGTENYGTENNKAVIDLLSEYAGRTIGDQYLEEDKSVHQRISNQKEDKSIGTRMQQKPIASLREAIGVNEKFLFINELFKGNIQTYNEAISRLNEMDDGKAAFDYLNELSMIHSWDANRSASTIEKLADLVHRRHMSTI